MQNGIIEFYGRGGEAGRLSQGGGIIEKLRTLDILSRFLPPAPATVLDVGGAAGVYALPLAEKGYEVHLVDPVPLHVDQARRASAARDAHPLKSVVVGHAEQLPFGDATADAVLMLGPLYHLTEESRRLRALGEARRCLRPGGVLFAAAISRFASLTDGLLCGMIEDPLFVEIVKQDLATGRHDNRGNPAYFTTAFFHRPRQLVAEVSAAGFSDARLLGVEGPAWRSERLDGYLSSPAYRQTLMELLALAESDADMLASSAHFICVGWKQS